MTREPSLLAITAPLRCGASSVSRINSNCTTRLPDFGIVCVVRVGEQLRASQKAAIHPGATHPALNVTRCPGRPAIVKRYCAAACVDVGSSAPLHGEIPIVAKISASIQLLSKNLYVRSLYPVAIKRNATANAIAASTAIAPSEAVNGK